jgi:uncharacterized protein
MSAVAGVARGIVDCDFPGPQASFEAVGPYLPEAWRQYLQIGASRKLSGSLSLESTFRDPRGALDAPAAEGDGIAHAVVHAGFAGAISGLANERLAAQVAAAANDWLIAEWLEQDPRLLGSVLVAPRDARSAAAEIERVGSHPRMVQVVLAFPPSLLGERPMRDVLAAAAAQGLAVQLQAGGAFTGISRGLHSAGHPTSRYEYELGWLHAAQPQLLSAVAGGVFERFPSLKLVFSGFGVTWLPGLLWAMDAEWRAGRVARPRGLPRLPSEVVAEHVRFTTTLLEQPPPGSEDRLGELLAPICAQQLLVLGGNYPSTETRSDAALARLPAAWRERVGWQNARELYRL